MLDLFLRADDEEQAKVALPDFVGPDGAWRHATAHWAFDPVGAIVAEPAVFDGLQQLTPATFVPGWHANIRLLDASLLPTLETSGLLIETPATPARNWS